MGRYSNPLALRDAQIARFKRLNMDARSGHQDLAIQGLNDMLQLTGGGLSAKTLRRMGHPFARASKIQGIALNSKARGSRLKVKLNGKTMRVKAPLLPINVQTGRLRRSMRLQKVAGGTQSFSVGPDRSAGASINVLRPGGTKNMVARGFWSEVKTRFRSRNAAFIEHFVRSQKRP